MPNEPEYNHSKTHFTGLSKGGLAHWVAHQGLSNGAWIIVPHPRQLNSIANNISFWAKQNKISNSVYIYPEDDPRTFDGASPSPSFSLMRAQVLDAFCQGRQPIVVSTPLAAVNRTINLEDFQRAYVDLRLEQDISPSRLLRKLNHIGYYHSDIIDSEGLYRHKGDSLYIWPVNAAHPFMLSFFGDEIERIDALDAQSYKVKSQKEMLTISPAREYPLRLSAIRRAEQHTQAQVDHFGRSQGLRNRAMNDLKNGLWFPGAEAYIAASYPLFPVIKHCSNIILYDSIECESVMVDWSKKLPHRWETLDNTDTPPINPALQFVCADEIPLLLNGALHTGQLVAGGREMDMHSPHDLSLSASTISEWAKRLKSLLNRGFVISMVSKQQHMQDRIQEILEANGLPYHHQNSYYPSQPNGIALIQGQLSEGFMSYRLQTLVLSAEDIFGKSRKAHKTRSKKTLHAVSRQTFLSLTVGDYVVHQDHGIGQYQGVEQVKVNGEMIDYVKLLYRHQEELLLPANYLEKIQIYRSASGPPLRLDKIGSPSWSKRKAKIKEKAVAFAHELLRQQANRQQRNGYSYPIQSELLTNVGGDFPFDLTGDQHHAIEELLQQLNQPKATDFLLVGDVGFGKTEVAIRAIAAVLSEGHQVLFLCPTTVLALQHHRNLARRFKPHGVTVGMLSRLADPKQNRRTKSDFSKGQLQVLIGTQSLLSRSLTGQHVGLVIVDEEHRFGVQQKEKIRAFAQSQSHPAEYLAMSATPIPRTLHMALSGLRDVSVIATPPYGRRPVRTLCFQKSHAKIRGQIKHELNRGGQVFYIHNRVKGLDEMTRQIQELVPNAVVRSAHGQMDRKQLERTLVDFMEHRFHVLVCTSIVENGVDLPNVNTIIIDNAHLMGLSQLYQLRGRVGRSEQQGYCTFLIPQKITKEAMNRISTLQRYTELGSGFSVAAADLELRGSGNLLGKEQSGHIQSVGLDTYLDILQQVVDELSQKQNTVSIDADIKIPNTGHIPESYIPSPEERLKLHSALATAEHIHETRGLLDEWELKYGHLPQELRQLVWHAESRIWCKILGIRILHWLKTRVHVQIDSQSPITEKRAQQIAKRYEDRMTLRPKGPHLDLYIRFNPEEAEHPFHFLLWVFQTLKPPSA